MIDMFTALPHNIVLYVFQMTCVFRNLVYICDILVFCQIKYFRETTNGIILYLLVLIRHNIQLVIVLLFHMPTSLKSSNIYRMEV